MKFDRSKAMKLSWAVRKFNQTISELETEENKLYLPEKIDYKKIKENIYSSKTLKQTINNLNRFSNENEQKIIKISEENYITNWELKEMKKEKRRYQRRLERDLIEVQEENAEKRIGFSTKEEREIKSNLKSLEKINKLQKLNKIEFKRLKEKLHRGGIRDYDRKKDRIFRENYMFALSEVKNYKNYKVLKEKLNSIKNDREFYEFLKQSDSLMDLFLYYDDETGYHYSGFTTNEEAFNYGLEEVGLI